MQSAQSYCLFHANKHKRKKKIHYFKMKQTALLKMKIKLMS
jgi:hypothetical protein